MTARRPALRVVASAALVLLCAGTGAAQGIDPFYEFLMARRLEAAGDAAGALAALERAAEADPSSAEIRAEIASFHLRRNDRDLAETEARAALTLDADNVEAHRVLGLLVAAYADGARSRSAREAREYADEAIAHLERAVDDPSGATDIGLQYTLGRLYLRVGRDADAVAVLGVVVAENPGSVQARLTLAQAYAAAGRLDGAIDTLAAIVDQAPRVAAALGQYQEQAGRFLDAAGSYQIALGETPDNQELKFRRIIVLYNAGRFDQVVELAAEAAAQHPGDLRFDRLRARGLFDAGQRDQAYAVMRAMVASNPQDGTLQIALADLYDDGGRTADAEETLRVLVRAQPANAVALNYLGYMLADDGRALDEAVSLVQRALELDPDNPSYLDSLGWAYYHLGELDEAGRYLEPAAEQLPENSVVLDHLGDLRSRQGRLREAIAAWEQALAGDGDEIDRAAIERKIDIARSELPEQR